MKTALVSAVCLFGLASAGLASTLSNCALDSVSNNWICNVYDESATSGLPGFGLGFTISPGYIVLMDSGNPGTGYLDTTTYPDQANTSLWSDVMWFPDSGLGSSNSVVLLDSGFPTLATMGSSVWFQLENQAGATQYVADTPLDVNNPGHIYNVYSAVPEPVSMGLIGSGLIVLGVLGLRRRRRQG